MTRDTTLVSEFERWRLLNDAGGWRCRWRRRSVWLAQIAQRAGLQRTVTVPLFFGARMQVITGEEMSSAVLAFGYTEVALTSLMLRVLKPGDFVVDVGTHFGYEALLASHLVGAAGRVVTFEPNPDAIRVAAPNLAARTNVELVSKAVGDREGTIVLERPPIGQSAFARTTPEDVPTGRGLMVPLTTLDATLGTSTRPIRFLKSDVEGGEEAVLRGARRLLAKDAPLLVLEADFPESGGEPSPRAQRLAQFLRPLGYTGYSFDYDGQFRVAHLGGLPVGHANIAFACGTDRALLESLRGS